MNKLVKILTGLALSLVLMTSTVRAAADIVTISTLPEYTNTDTFKLSFSALSSDPVSAQFYSRKDAGSYSSFGPVINSASGQVQVTGSQIGEQTKYFFKVVINGVASAETSVIFDTSGPSPVRDYRREQVSPEHFRLFWKNPSDSDFSRTFIYRSTSTNFTADGLTKVGELGGAPDAEMSWDNFGLDASKTYYYALRAVDKAGNGSGVVSDVGTTVTEGGVAGVSTAAGGEETVSLLPRGEVLAESASEEDETATDSESIEAAELDLSGLDEVAGEGQSTARRVATAVATAFLVYYTYRFFARRKRD